MQFLNYDNEKPIECGFDRVKGGWQMRYFSVAEMAKKWDVSERSVRNYCAHGRVPGVFITGKTWNIPENAKKPERSNKKKEKKTTLLDILLDEKANKYSRYTPVSTIISYTTFRYIPFFCHFSN